MKFRQCVVIVEDGEVLADVEVEHLLDRDGEARIDGQHVPVSFQCTHPLNGKLVFQQEEEKE